MTCTGSQFAATGTSHTTYQLAEEPVSRLINAAPERTAKGVAR
jgi:hypothetical protein